MIKRAAILRERGGALHAWTGLEDHDLESGASETRGDQAAGDAGPDDDDVSGPGHRQAMPGGGRDHAPNGPVHVPGAGMPSADQISAPVCVARRGLPSMV